MAERRRKYVCPKCKSVWTNTKSLEFCVCGEKIQENLGDIFNKDTFKEMNDIFGLGN